MLYFWKIGSKKNASNFVVYIIKFIWFNSGDKIYNICDIRYIKCITSPWFTKFDKIGLTVY